MSLTGHRVEGWHVEHLTRSGATLGTLDGVLGGRVEGNVNAIISGGGSLTLDRRAAAVDFLSDRLRVWWTVNGEPWPMGTFLPVMPAGAFSDGGLATYDVGLLDTLTVLAEDGLEAAYSLAAGSVVTTAITSLISAAGEVAAVTPSAETLLGTMVWPAGTTRLRIINDLLASINYFSLRADGLGHLRAAPYSAPAHREVSWRFEPGAAAVHVADMVREEDLFALPNRVVLVAQGDGDAEGLVASATNADPAHRLSTVARGRTITLTEENVEATSQSVLNAMAAQRLLDASTPYAKIEIAHAVLPLGINDVVVVHVDGVERRGVVQTTSTELAVGALARTVLLEVGP